ncbi:putative aldo keto reductase protein [Botrytis cinerea BcDW1]|nr:putative aldo keto reductase protein [Botrytis cinerea BcDW1]
MKTLNDQSIEFPFIAPHLGNMDAEHNAAKSPAKAAHVNMMTDCIIANMPVDGLRSILRGLLGENTSNTASLTKLASKYLANTKPSSIPELFDTSDGSPKPTLDLQRIQSRYRCLMGCGFGFESVELLTAVIHQIQKLEWNDGTAEGEEFLEILATIDGDVVQSTTAVHKLLLTSSGMRPMNTEDSKTISTLREILYTCRSFAITRGQDFPFERGLCCLEKLIEGTGSEIQPLQRDEISRTNGFKSSKIVLESFQLGPAEVPRMFMGLWQFSSPAWGTASRSKIDRHFRKHVDSGLIAYDMADHYGDAEVTFGQFRSGQEDSEKIYCATKWAVFEPIQVTKEVVDANISERLTAINSTSVELLQFHWQDYNDHQYVEAARLIEMHPNVQSLGLCNFDSDHMCEILESGVKAVSNQVQFSLIDLRPTFKMAESCRKHKVKLLTYGSLCGGFLAEKWIGKPAPNLFDKNMTPSHRKYFEMINIWGGWILFQELLNVLAKIGSEHNVSVSSAAIRWVLDHDYVGAVIIGARMGISEHIDENLKALSFILDEEDKEAIQNVLNRSRAKDIFEAMGDCGAEYRQIRRKAQRSNAQTGSGSIAESPNQPPNANLRDETERRISPNSTPSGILDTSPPQTAHSWSNEGLQQVGILSREAQFGKFSLENILSVPDVLRPHPPPRSPTLTADSFNDPITCNMLSFPVALGLFDSFMRCLNPYICQLDPKLHTFDYVRQRSSFLLAAILSASSKAFHPALHPTLRSHTENLLGRVFTKGAKSTEIVQAILIFTYWKEPAEIRTWLLVGYAIRMCIELGWHELKPVTQKPRISTDEMSIRESRNIERTWLVLFVYDRSLSLQLDKPWMIDESNLISKAGEWYQEEYAVPGGDLLLSAFVCLRLISAEFLELSSSTKSDSQNSRSEILSKLLNTELNTWEKDWLPKFEDEMVAPPQQFLVNFYSLHLRLLLNSFTLQKSLKSARKGSPVSKSALWQCSSSAIGMLENISKVIGPLKQLYFVQDSVHVMTAYAAIFLIKLLLSLPKNLRSDLETQSLQAILLSSDTFSEQCATQMTGCAMQARFLKNLVAKYHRLKSHTSNQVRDHGVHSYQSGMPTSLESLHSRMNTDVGTSYQIPRPMQDTGELTDATSINGSTPDFSTDLLNDKEIWDGLLTDAGFWMSEGNILSDNSLPR